MGRLILSRKKGERIVIRDRRTQEEIVIETHEIKPNGVRLMFTAPAVFDIVREELELADTSPAAARVF